MTPAAESPPNVLHRPWRGLLAALGCAAWLAGCAAPPPPDLPQPQAHEPSTQKTARAVHHWDVLAADVAARTASRLRDWPSGAHPIYVVPAEGEGGGFGPGFRTLLVTHLVERGLAVSTQPSGVRLVVGVQLVQHVALPGTGARPVLLGEGVSVARNASMENGDYLLAATAAPVVAPTAAASRQALARGPARTEILVTTSLEGEDRYLARTSDVYFIDQADAALYLPAPPASVGPPPVAVKTWQVVAP
ncbi:hypothetical protein M5C99_08300 [Acidovorax sp. NCPPB 2350]|nr:hypothetical protein M5C99_08300 [Acidovorax sp. NCPPB 2350]